MRVSWGLIRPIRPLRKVRAVYICARDRFCRGFVFDSIYRETSRYFGQINPDIDIDRFVGSRGKC
jgi:hypothetical protein